MSARRSRVHEPVHPRADHYRPRWRWASSGGGMTSAGTAQLACAVDLGRVARYCTHLQHARAGDPGGRPHGLPPHWPPSHTAAVHRDRSGRARYARRRSGSGWTRSRRKPYGAQRAGSGSRRAGVLLVGRDESAAAVSVRLANVPGFRAMAAFSMFGSVFWDAHGRIFPRVRHGPPVIRPAGEACGGDSVPGKHEPSGCGGQGR
jgi:hypothetical protein